MNEPRNLVKEWFDLANEDWEAARIFHDSRPRLAVYHYHQAVEKVLKGQMVKNKLPIKKTHVISTLVVDLAQVQTDLLALCKDIDLDKVTSYATYFRYPNEDGRTEPKKEEVASVAKFAQKLRLFCGLDHPAEENTITNQQKPYTWLGKPPK